MLLTPLTPAGRRWVVGLVALLATAVLTAIGARLAGGHHTSQSHAAAGPTATSSPAAGPTSTVTGPAASQSNVARTTDPIEFAQDFTRVLWSYDTSTSRTSYLASLSDWLTTEGQYADPASVTTQVPSEQVWAEMSAQHQHATATGLAGHIPAQFTQALNADPGELSVAYIYAVTVTGTQHIVWAGGQGTEARSITVAVQCRPDQDCSLAAISPTVYP